MIKHLKIQNYQSHKSTRVAFNKGVNIIIGTSDSGKTAILRALRWVTTNKPGGEAYRSSWGGDTIVKASFDNCTVTRTKGKQNKYQLDDKEFKAFGKDVPFEIKKSLNIGDVNLQRQMDSPYLLSDTPGEIASHFNKMANLSIIDDSLSNINKQISKMSSNNEICKSIIATTEKKLSSFECLDALFADIQKSKELSKTIEDLDLYATQLDVILKDLNTCKINQQPLKDITIAEVDIDNILEYIASGKTVKQNIKDLSNCIVDIEKNKENQQALSKYVNIDIDIDRIIAKMEKCSRISGDNTDLYALIHNLQINYVEQEHCTQKISCETDIDRILKRITYISEFANTNKQLERFLLKYNRLIKEQVEIQTTYATLTKEFHEAMPSVCPLCDQPIKK